MQSCIGKLSPYVLPCCGFTRSMHCANWTSYSEGKPIGSESTAVATLLYPNFKPPCRVNCVILSDNIGVGNDSIMWQKYSSLIGTARQIIDNLGLDNVFSARRHAWRDSVIWSKICGGCNCKRLYCWRRLLEIRWWSTNYQQADYIKSASG